MTQPITKSMKSATRHGPGERLKAIRKVRSEARTKEDNGGEPQTVIYGLCDPRINDPCKDIRYVGKADITSGNDPNRRFNRHISNAVSGEQNHRSQWIRQLNDAGLQPSVIIIDVVSTPEWEQAEKAAIAAARDAGYPLTNLSDGGEGTSGVQRTEEQKRQLSLKMKGVNKSEATKEKMRKGRKGGGAGRKQSPEEIEKRCKKLRGQQRTPEQCENIAEGARKAWSFDPTREEARIAALTGKPMPPQTKAALHDANTNRACTPETRAKISAANLGRIHTPLARANMSAGHTGKVLSDDHKDNIGRASQARWQNDLEYRQKIQGLTPDMLEQAALAYIGGLSYEAIAQQLPVCKDAIRRGLTGKGYYAEMLRLLPDELQVKLKAEIGRRNGLDGRALSVQQVAEAKEMRSTGDSYAQIGRKLCVGHSTVRQAVLGLGAYSREDG